MDVKSLTIWRDLLASTRPDRVEDIAELTARIDNAELQWRFANQDKTNEGSINEIVKGDRQVSNINLEVKSVPAEYLTAADLVVLRDLAARGFALAVWTPDEIDGLDATDIEELMIEAASDYIQNNQDNRF